MFIGIENFLPVGKRLYDFQVDTVDKTLSFLEHSETNSCYVANEMGLGKSITSLVTANCLGSKRVLIICPAIMRLVWRKEVLNWMLVAPHIETILTGSDFSNLQDLDNPNLVLILSYALVSKADILKKLCSVKWDLLILDEAHAVKNFKALRTRAVLKDIYPRCKYKLLLSGSPMTRDVTDLYPPLAAIMPSKFSNWYSFCNAYARQRRVPWGNGIQFYGLRNADTLSRIMRTNFYVRFKKDDVLKQLPKKMFQTIVLEDKYSVRMMAKKDRDQLAEDFEQLLSAINSGKAITVLPASISEHRRVQGELKAKPVAEFAIELLEQEIPIVIFAHHHNVIDKLEEELAEYRPVAITGETPAKVREGHIQDFQDGKTNCFIGNFVAAGVGITLTRSCTVLLAELDYSPANISQAIDRVHRIGQESQVLVYSFSVDNSLDKDIEAVVMRKVEEFNLVCD